MSIDDLHQHAESSTPQNVHVPNTWAGLIMWAMGKFGAAIVWAAVASYGLWIVYGDMRSQNAQLLAAFVQQSKTNSELVDSIHGFTDALNGYNRELHDKRISNTP